MAHRAYAVQLACLTSGLAMVWADPGFADTRLCWQPKQLRAQPGEHAIRKGIRQAYVPAPRGRPHAADAGFRMIPGAIRRVRLPKGQRLVALTFDLCEQPYEITGYQGDIVDYLRANKIPATFFAGGKWMLTHSQRAQQIMADPLFELANHSWEHRNFRLLSGARLEREIDGAQRAYERTRAALAQRRCRMPGVRGFAHEQAPRRMSLFRFPFGACNARALQVVNQRGLLAIQWDVSSADPWKGLTAERMVRHVLDRARSGSIIIFHANGRGWRTGEALPAIISGLRRKGFGFATVSQLLAVPGATPVVSRTCYDVKPGDADRYDELGRRLEARYQQFYSSVGAPAAAPVKPAQ